MGRLFGEPSALVTRCRWPGNSVFAIDIGLIVAGIGFRIPVKSREIQWNLEHARGILL